MGKGWLIYVGTHQLGKCTGRWEPGLSLEKGEFPMGQEANQNKLGGGMLNSEASM